MRKVYIEVPELPTVAKFLLLDRPETIYINLSCKTKDGTIMIVVGKNTETQDA